MSEALDAPVLIQAGTNAFVEMSVAAYHADPCAQPSLSASIARLLDSKSPMHAALAHPRLGGVSRAPTKSTDNGTLAHALLLGAGPEVVAFEADDWRTKDAQAFRKEARRNGQLPVLLRELDEATEAADSLRQRFAELGIVIPERRELPVFWTETAEDGFEVQCRGMLDAVDLDEGIVIDLKSSYSAHPDACRRHVDGFGYEIQSAAYRRAFGKVRPELLGRVQFLFVFFETVPPFAVTPVRLSRAYADIGERRWLRAVNTWAKCLQENRFPGYVTETVELEPSPWTLNEEIEHEAAHVAA